MTRPRIPVYNQTADWPRKVAEIVRSAQNDIEALQSPAALLVASRSVSADTTLTTADYLVLVDATAAARTITLPPVASSTGSQFVIKKTDASGNAVTVDGNASETIDGATMLALAAQYDAITVACDGTAWWVL